MDTEVEKEGLQSRGWQMDMPRGRRSLTDAPMASIQGLSAWGGAGYVLQIVHNEQAKQRKPVWLSG